MDQQAFQVLQCKLDALNYRESLEEASAPLVQRLVDDLIHTTESYHGLRKQATSFSQHVASLNDKARVLAKSAVLQSRVVK